MPERSPEDPRAVRNRLIWEDAFAWIGRIFATMVFMVGPALAGLWLDRQLGTKFLAAIGIMLGMALGITALLILVNVKRPSLDEDVSEEVNPRRGLRGDTTETSDSTERNDGTGRTPGTGGRRSSDNDQALP